jgi:hypothetical protein
MGHLAIVNNLLVAVGGSPQFDRPNLPLAPGYHPSCFVVRLTPFDRETLDHFIYLERPEQEQSQESEAFEPIAELPRDPPSDRITPHAADYETIGQLYGAVRERLKLLVDQRGEEALVAGMEDGQIGPEILRRGKPGERWRYRQPGSKRSLMRSRCRECGRAWPSRAGPG